jgi:hypothetical protein
MANNKVESLAVFCANLGAATKSLLKITLGGSSAAASSPIWNSESSTSEPLYILGNGPSLRQNIDNDLALLTNSRTLAVNFAANSPEFQQLKPNFYVLADPHFFNRQDDSNVALLLKNLSAVTWEMTLFVPTKSTLPTTLLQHPYITVCHFNFVAIEGFEWLEHIAFKHRLGMPRPRNVLIPSIMIGIWLGFHNIYLLGADHSWLKTLSVDDNNRVVSIQPHFYKEDAKEEQRISATYVNIRLHEVLKSFYIAFQSYHRLQRYASTIGVNVFNATPGSMIDAFPRRSISNPN